MSLSQLRNVNFGPSKANLTGSTGVGYSIYNTDGSLFQARTTVGVYQIVSGSGIYAAFAAFPDNFHGQIFWDTGETLPQYAIEQFNVEENDPKVALTYDLVQLVTGTVNTTLADIQFLQDMEGGRWKIDTSTNRMLFFKSDNVTLVAQFDLFDSTGVPSSNQVSERRRV